MPIRPFLAGQSFDPEAIDAMSRTLKSVCEELGLISVADDPATRTIAKNIIECAQRGIRDADALQAIVLEEFRNATGDEPKSS
jgi:nucleoside 2-deoxyribosyltransferase